MVKCEMETNGHPNLKVSQIPLVWYGAWYLVLIINNNKELKTEGVEGGAKQNVENECLRNMCLSPSHYLLAITISYHY